MKQWKPCRHHKTLRLNPDFTSSGIECADCGIVFLDPEKEFPQIPKDVIDLVQVWNWAWEAFSEMKSVSEELYKTFHSAGERLVKLINEYYPCSNHNSTWEFMTKITPAD